MCTVKRPPGSLTHVEVIRRVQDACDTLVETVTRNHRPPMSCQEGCDWCCRQPVYITPLEGVAIRAFVDANRFEKRVQRETERYLGSPQKTEKIVRCDTRLRKGLSGRAV